MSPVDGTVTIDGDAAGVGEQTVTITNHFQVGAVPVVLERIGAGTPFYGVGPFEVTAQCSHNIDGVETKLDLPNGGKVTLNAENSYQSALVDIPVGAVCDFEETADGGAHNWYFAAAKGTRAASEDGKVETVPVTGDSDQQAVTAVNEFEAGHFDFTKEISGDGAQKYGTGTFGFEYDCTLPEGTLSGADAPATSGLFSLKAGEVWQSDLFPAGATCTVSETSMGGANFNSIPDGAELVIANVEEFGDIDVPTSVEFTATNTFEVGSVEISKKLTGGGATAAAGKTFEAQVTCTYDVDGVETDVDLPEGGKVELSRAGGWKASVEDIPAGAECQIVETDNGGAEKVTLDPEDGKVLIVAGEAANVTITNQFAGLAGPGLSETGARWVGLYSGLAAGLALVGGGMLWSARRRKAKG